MLTRTEKRLRKEAIDRWTELFSAAGELEPRRAATDVVDFELEHSKELSLDRLIQAAKEEGDRS